MNLLSRVYDKTNSGLDIITDLVTGIDDAVINRKKAFKLRPDERTASAHLYPPKDGSDCWHVKDYGMSCLAVNPRCNNQHCRNEY